MVELRAFNPRVRGSSPRGPANRFVGVAQRFRVPACQVGGRGFESRRPLQVRWDLSSSWESARLASGRRRVRVPQVPPEFRRVAQSGQGTGLGNRWSQVRILSRRPISERSGKAASGRAVDPESQVQVLGALPKSTLVAQGKERGFAKPEAGGSIPPEGARSQVLRVSGTSEDTPVQILGQRPGQACVEAFCPIAEKACF